MRQILLITFHFLIPYLLFAQNYCLNFTGSDHINISSNFSLGTSNISLECWVFIPGTSEHGTFVNVGDGSNGYGIGVGSGSFDNPGNELIFINNMVNWHGTGVNMGTGWHHTAFTIDGSGNTVVYLDGKNVLSFSETPHTPSNSSYIGETNDGSRILTNGKIDEVRIWNTARSQVNINKYMFKELQGNETNLVAYYKMSNGSGTTLTDNSSGGNNGTITGAAWQTSGAFSGPRNALDFDGSDDYVEVPSGLSFSSTSAITIEGWVYPRSFNSASPDNNISNVAGYTDASALVRIGDAIIDNNQLQFVLFTSDRLNSNARLSTNTWYHFAAVFDGSKSYLYINGKLDNSMATSANNFTSSGSFILGGVDGTSRALDGLMDELKIWSTARTASEIRTDMMRTLSGSETGLLAYYRFDQADGTTLYDYSSNGYDATLNNMDGSTDWVGSSAFNTWIGSESSDWNTAANWSYNSVPISYDNNVGIYSYIGGNEFSSNSYGASIGVNNMLVSTSSTLSLPMNINITGNLILESNLNLGTHNISLGSSGYLIEDAGNAAGTTGLITCTQNPGTLSSENIAGLGLTITAGSSTGYISIYRGFAQSSGGLTDGLYRYYNLNIQNGQSIDLVFNYFDSEVTGTESNLCFFQTLDDLEGGAFNWSKESSCTINTTANTITLSSFNIASGTTYRITGADLNSPMPVELTNFTANAIDGKVHLNWQTATEVNNYGFDVERKMENGEWITVGFVEGYGNSNSPKEYSFTNESPASGILYYRLKQIDNDGKYKYSGVVEVQSGIPVDFGLSQNYPNPFNPTTTIQYSLPKTGNVKLTVYNVLGEKVADLVNETKEAGIHTVNFDASNFNSGLYFYKIETNGFTQTRKMMLIK